MRTEIAFVLTGMQDALGRAGASAVLVWAGVVLWIGLVLLLDRWGFLP